ncbi:MAG TPA: SDR family NAD(P)-dependent oxidoreductase [Chitinophagaceae bacterium]|nr:SDR family NAD(P)-dependent oxidoreductase [Chitinophagaceae bacterium]
MNVVITGASRGLGKCIAEQFAGDKQGHTVVMCARSKETLDIAGRELQGRFPRSNIKTYACDLSRKEEVLRFGDWVLQQVPQIDVLVNNAGTFTPGSVHNEPEGALEEMVTVNLYSAYHLTRRLLPRMMEQKKGHIFNMCSIASLKAYNNGGAYSISKFALLGFSRNLREELKTYNIKVTAVLPGAAYTDSWASSGVDPKRIMEASDIAALVYASAHLSPQACVEDIVVRPQLGDL